MKTRIHGHHFLNLNIKNFFFNKHRAMNLQEREHRDALCAYSLEKEYLDVYRQTTRWQTL